MVFREIPLIRIGRLMINFGGADANGQANFVPFKTILPYLFGYKGWIVAGINLVGNIALLVPFGFLVTSIYRNITWKKCLVLSIVVPGVIEGSQALLQTGIFDIDDVILNGLGIMIGYFIFRAFAK
ncbi:MAG: VanZ family protein [Candidatus Taylorbacteria bacterium]|nr:VanZ family protein [Candidatus Taylorbacteria bacterium]